MRLLEELPDVIPLTSAEKTRLTELETIVEGHLDAFLLTGKALGEIRNRRLYRVEYPTFEAYLKCRWGLPVARANEVIASYGCAELLFATTGAPDSKTPLPPRVPEGVMRSIAKLQGDELRAQTWRLIATINNQSGASLRAVAYQVSHAVRAALEEVAQKENGQRAATGDAKGDAKGGVKHGAMGAVTSVATSEITGAVPGEATGAATGETKDANEEVSSKTLKAPKMIFVGSILQLARSKSFDVQLAILHLKSETEAIAVYKACRLIATRCTQVEALLENRYPQLRCPPVPADV